MMTQMERYDFSKIRGHTPFPWQIVNRPKHKTRTNVRIVSLEKIHHWEDDEVKPVSRKVQREPYKAIEDGDTTINFASIGTLHVPSYGPKDEDIDRWRFNHDEFAANARLMKQLPKIINALKEAYEEIDKLENALSTINALHFPKE